MSLPNNTSHRIAQDPDNNGIQEPRSIADFLADLKAAQCEIEARRFKQQIHPKVDDFANRARPYLKMPYSKLQERIKMKGQRSQQITLQKKDLKEVNEEILFMQAVE